MRWQSKSDVIKGKGFKICSSTKCDETRGLSKYEVLFKYKENDEIKHALVKASVC